ncbi:MAG: ABC transporter ATP-binding protein [Peptoniphilaceae bacterium]
MKKTIDVKDLSFSYKSNKDALKNLSFSVLEGEVFGFLGPNGSGKSTTQMILTGMARDYRGSVKILDKEIKEIDVDFLNNIGVLFEYPYFYTSLSGYDNLKYFSSFYNTKQRDINELLEELGFKMSFLKKPVSTYSKGMKQRINMARALITNPKVLFLDEPTSGLDPAGASLFRTIIQKEKDKGVTIFLTTHNMHDADLLCDRVAFIVDGSIVTIDSPSKLKEKNSMKEIEVNYRLNGDLLKKLIPLSEDGLNKIDYDEIISINTREPTLEDIFIEHTGKGLK